MIDKNQNQVIKSEMYHGQESQNLLNYKFLLQNWPGKKVIFQRNIYVYDYTLSLKRRVWLCTTVEKTYKTNSYNKSQRDALFLKLFW